MIKVGLIDSGVSEAQLQLVANQRDFTGSGTIVDQLGHGSAIVDRLLSAQVDIEICVARIFADQLLCGVEECAAAVDWLVGLEPSLITMSFGLRRDSRILREACSAAVEAGVGIVAASPAPRQPAVATGQATASTTPRASASRAIGARTATLALHSSSGGGSSTSRRLPRSPPALAPPLTLSLTTSSTTRSSVRWT